MYVAIEGIDTAGKTTQIQLLKKVFKDAVFIKEPGETELGKVLRKIIFNDKISKKSELFLFLADRSETMEKIVQKNLDKLVISDRSLISGIAYGLEYFDYFDLKFFNSFATSEIYPDLVVILKLDKKTLETRLSQKEHDNIEKRGVDYLLSIQKNLIEVTEKLSLNFLIIDASLKIDEIHKKIVERINVENN